MPILIFMRLCPILAVLLLFQIETLQADSTHTHSYMSKAKCELLHDAQEAVINDDFALLDSLHAAFLTTFPNDPAHYLILVAAKMAHMSYDECGENGKTFVALTDSMFAEVKERVDTAVISAQPWYYLIAGHACLYRSLYESKFGSKFVAMRYGFGAMEYYQRGYQLDSTNVDLLLGMGSFRYWKSTKAGFLRTIGLIKNERLRGYHELRRVADESLISAPSARSALVYVYLDMDSLTEAYTLAESLLREYPHGRSMRWALGEILLAMDSTSAARAQYISLRHELESSPNNCYNLISCDAAIMKSYTKEDALEQASKHAQHSLASYPELSKEVRSRQSARLSKLRDLANDTPVTAVAVPMPR